MNGRIKINSAGGSPAASHFSCLAKKSNPKKAPPVCRRFAVPCVARLVRRLRNSRYALRQSSPKSPDQPPLLGGAQGIEKQKSKPTAWALRAHPWLGKYTGCRTIDDKHHTEGLLLEATNCRSFNLFRQFGERSLIRCD